MLQDVQMPTSSLSSQSESPCVREPYSLRSPKLVNMHAASNSFDNYQAKIVLHGYIGY